MPDYDDEEFTDTGALAAVRPTEPVEDADEDVEFVEYKGRATTRRITSEQWAKAGVDDHAETVWEAENEFKVPVSELSESALKLLRRDGSFSVPAEAAE